jgi:LacI family transcriptional regulator
MTSIKDIARLAGVSASTVSRVLNEREYVRGEVRKRVLDIVKEKGYVQNHVARSMVLRRTFTIGIVIPDTFNMFQRQLFATIEHFLEKQGYRSLFFFVKWDAESELSCLKRIKSEILDGIIMLHELRNPAIYKQLAESGKPTVLCTFEREDHNFPTVHIGEEAAAQEAVRYLVSHGHRNIGILRGEHFSFGVKRANGYEAVLKEQGIPVRADASVTVPSYTPEAGREGMKHLLVSNPGMTAVFAVTDELAIGAIRAAYEAGLRVPDDISIIGLDDIDISPFTTPSLTTVRQPIIEMGKKTAEIVCELIAKGNSPREPALFTHELVERESVARI